MAESTKTKTREDTDKADASRTATADQETAQQDNTDAEHVDDLQPQPALSYAGSGTTEPVELSAETHGTHFRGPMGGI